MATHASEDVDYPKSCECGSNHSLDMKTPRNVHLSAFYKRSFAFYTVKNRMPVILTNTIDNLVRSKQQIYEKYGEAAAEELKTIIGEISEYKYEVQTNKPLKPLNSDACDVKVYNNYLVDKSIEEGHTTHFHTIWLLTECYMYRRLRDIFETKTILKDYDPFEHQKQTAYTTALPLIEKLGQYLLQILNCNNPADKKEFIQLIKLNLWGNKCDLSLSLGKVDDDSTLFDTAALDSYILCDHSEEIWQAISVKDSSDIVAIVFDNAGYEAFTDLCLADYIISKQLAKSIRLYVKIMPWFISDVMKHDFYWMLEQLKNSCNENLRKLGNRWTEYVNTDRWTIIVSDFWTFPFDFTYMSKVDPHLYKQLAETKLAIFKGDLNYRKLFGEKNWDPITPVDVGLQNFNPTKLAIIRTVKADIVCGLQEGQAEECEAKDVKWMETGNYGLIQFSNKIVVID